MNELTLGTWWTVKTRWSLIRLNMFPRWTALSGWLRRERLNIHQHSGRYRETDTIQTLFHSTWSETGSVSPALFITPTDISLDLKHTHLTLRLGEIPQGSYSLFQRSESFTPNKRMNAHNWFVDTFPYRLPFKSLGSERVFHKNIKQHNCF